MSVTMPVVITAATFGSFFSGAGWVFLLGGAALVGLAVHASRFPGPQVRATARDRLADMVGASTAYLAFHAANVGLRPRRAAVVVRALWVPLLVGVALLWASVVVGLVTRLGEG
jgi:hypothetical protein